MKISTMIKREKFYEVLIGTLRKYSKNRFSNISKLNNETVSLSRWNIYEEINVIILGFPSLYVLKYVLNQFNLRHGFVRRTAAKTFVVLSLFSHGILSKKKIVLSDIMLPNKSLIWPCNRSIRIFDFERMIVVSILKDGFPDLYFHNAITFRSNQDYDFIPKITEFGDNWFEEVILSGKPLARVSNDINFRDYLDESINCINKLSKDTAKKTNLKEYLTKLLTNIKTLSEKAIKTKEIKSIEIINKMVKYSTDTLSKFTENTTITIVLSHGDLQTGNIWIDKEKVYIIDWETIKRRSIWYDKATLLFELRRYEGWIRLLDLVKFEDTLELDNNPCSNPKIISSIVLLEDIEFYLEDLLSLPNGLGAEGFDKKIEEGNQIRF